MTHSLSWMQALLTGFFRRKPEAETAVPVEALPPQRLRRLQVVVARCRGGLASEQLLVDQMSPDCMLFTTKGDFCEGDTLDVELLIRGFGSVQVPASVVWLRPTSGHTYQGELKLSPEPPQREALETFLSREAQGHR